MPPGLARARRAEDLLHRAQAGGDWSEQFVARLALAEANYHVPRNQDHLVHQASLRQAVDDPEHALSEMDLRRTLWCLKWAPSTMILLPEVPLDTIMASLADLTALFERFGYGCRPFLQLRAEAAQQRGDWGEESRAMAELATLRRDDLSDCHACEVLSQARAAEHESPQAARRARTLDEASALVDEASGHVGTHPAGAAVEDMRSRWAASAADLEHATDLLRALVDRPSLTDAQRVGARSNLCHVLADQGRCDEVLPEARTLMDAALGVSDQVLLAHAQRMLGPTRGWSSSMAFRKSFARCPGN